MLATLDFIYGGTPGDGDEDMDGHGRHGKHGGAASASKTTKSTKGSSMLLLGSDSASKGGKKPPKNEAEATAQLQGFKLVGQR